MSEETLYCDVCGCSMQYTTIEGDKIDIAALQFSLGIDEHLAKQVLGPYEHKRYSFCYQCALRVLGVPEP